jgi:hypothetical protein
LFDLFDSIKHRRQRGIKLLLPGSRFVPFLLFLRLSKVFSAERAAVQVAAYGFAATLRTSQLSVMPGHL